MKPHVLVARSDNNGDVLLAGPAIRAVAASARRVTLLCGPRGEDAAPLLPGVDDVIVRRLGWIDPEPQPVRQEQILELVHVLRRLRLDQAIILTSFHQSPLPLALLLRMAGVPKVAAISEDYPGSLLDIRHHVPDGIHEVERSLSLVARCGFPLPAGDDGRLQVNPLPGRSHDDAPYVVVHPGASAPARTWPADRHAALVRALVDSGRWVVVTGSVDERGLTHCVAGRHPRVSDLGGRLSFAQLGSVIRDADAIVVGNTGPAHLAAAVGTPVVLLFAPVVPAAKWRPWMVRHRLLGDQQAACANTRARECPIPGHPCLNSVTVAEVVGAVDSLAPLRTRVVA
jgi:ADP-heptose:LPS heptosyltransferase